MTTARNVCERPVSWLQRPALSTGFGILRRDLLVFWWPMTESIGYGKHEAFALSFCRLDHIGQIHWMSNPKFRFPGLGEESLETQALGLTGPRFGNWIPSFSKQGEQRHTCLRGTQLQYTARCVHVIGDHSHSREPLSKPVQGQKGLLKGAHASL